MSSDLIHALEAWMEKFKQEQKHQFKECVEGIVIEIRPRQTASRIVYTLRILPTNTNKQIMNLQVRPSMTFYGIVKKIYDELRQPLIKVCFDENYIPGYIEEIEKDVSEKILNVFRKKGIMHELSIHPLFGAVAYIGSNRVILSQDPSSLVYRKIEACGGRAEGFVFVYPIDNIAIGAIVQQCIENASASDIDVRQLIAEALGQAENEAEKGKNETTKTEHVESRESNIEIGENVSDEEIEKAVEELEKELREIEEGGTQ